MILHRSTDIMKMLTQELQEEDSALEFTAISRYGHIDISGEAEACCCYGRWHLELESDTKQVICFTDWQVGPDRPPPDEEGAPRGFQTYFRT